MALILLLSLSSLMVCTDQDSAGPQEVRYTINVYSMRIVFHLRRGQSDFLCDMLDMRRLESEVTIVIGSSSRKPTAQQESRR